MPPSPAPSPRRIAPAALAAAALALAACAGEPGCPEGTVPRAGQEPVERVERFLDVRSIRSGRSVSMCSFFESSSTP